MQKHGAFRTLLRDTAVKEPHLGPWGTHSLEKHTLVRLILTSYIYNHRIPKQGHGPRYWGLELQQLNLWAGHN